MTPIKCKLHLFHPDWFSYRSLNWIDWYWAIFSRCSLYCSGPSGFGMLSLIDIERIKSQTNNHTLSDSMCSEVQYLIPWEASSSLPIFSSSVDSPPYWSESKSDQPLSSCLTSILRNALPRTAALVYNSTPHMLYHHRKKRSYIRVLVLLDKNHKFSSFKRYGVRNVGLQVLKTMISSLKVSRLKTNTSKMIKAQWSTYRGFWWM